MRVRKLLVLPAALVIGWAFQIGALDSPHDGTFTTNLSECQACHSLHAPAGGTLTLWPANSDACLTCHDDPISPPSDFFTPAWSPTARVAVPGSGGDQHKWSGSATSLPGVRLATNPEMAPYAAGATLGCSLCHNVHGAKDDTGMPIQDTFAPNSAHSSYPLNVAQPPLLGGNARLKVTSLNNLGFLAFSQTFTLRVKSAGILEVSHDYRKAPPGTWVGNIPYVVGDTPANDVELDDPAVTVRIPPGVSGAVPAVGNMWEFYVSYPHLRASNVGDAMCLDCHADRHQSYECVEGIGSAQDGAGVSCLPNGTTRYYSHPVGQTLGANGKGYDAMDPLDADGSPQDEASEAVPSNKLALDQGKVGCTTCHAPHNADSNSLTNDVR